MECRASFDHVEDKFAIWRLTNCSDHSGNSTKKQNLQNQAKKQQFTGKMSRQNLLLYNLIRSPCSAQKLCEAGRSAVAARTIRVCAESVRVLDFLLDLLAIPVGLTREPTYNRSKPLPLYR